MVIIDIIIIHVGRGSIISVIQIIFIMRIGFHFDHDCFFNLVVGKSDDVSSRRVIYNSRYFFLPIVDSIVVVFSIIIVQVHCVAFVAIATVAIITSIFAIVAVTITSTVIIIDIFVVIQSSSRM